MREGEAQRESQQERPGDPGPLIFGLGDGCSERHVVEQREGCLAGLVRTALAAVPALDLGAVVVANTLEQLLQDVEQLRGSSMGMRIKARFTGPPRRRIGHARR